jgi:beta-N-acetylglucosaminidase
MKEVKDFSKKNPVLEDKTDEFKESNSVENKQISEVLYLMLQELIEIKKQLKKINF